MNPWLLLALAVCLSGKYLLPRRPAADETPLRWWERAVWYVILFGPVGILEMMREQSAVAATGGAIIWVIWIYEAFEKNSHLPPDQRR